MQLERSSLYFILKSCAPHSISQYCTHSKSHHCHHVFGHTYKHSKTVFRGVSNFRHSYTQDIKSSSETKRSEQWSCMHLSLSLYHIPPTPTAYYTCYWVDCTIALVQITSTSGVGSLKKGLRNSYRWCLQFSTEIMCALILHFGKELKYIQYRQFHKTLPKSSWQMCWISVRFNEMGDR